MSAGNHPCPSTSESRARLLAPRPESSQSIASTAPELAGFAKKDERQAKRRRIACQRCRQTKLKCEASDHGIQPCQRCLSNSWLCIVDITSHKRVNKAIRVAGPDGGASKSGGSADGVTGNAGDIRRDDTIASPPTSQTFSDTQEASATFVPDGLQLSPSCWNEHPEPLTSTSNLDAADRNTSSCDVHAFDERSNPGHPGLIVENSSSVRTIETVTISSEQIQHFFQVYYIHYHDSLPVLQPQNSPNSVYESSHLLFWTIIVTAARHDSCDYSLLPALLPCVKRLLWATIAEVPHMLPSLQAMSILCVWTFPVSSMPIDITFIIAGILKSAALHSGLHRPDILTHFSRTPSSLGPSELKEAVRVWSCAYVAIESVAAGNGQQPYFSTDRTIDQASAAGNPFNLPFALHQMIIVVAFCNRVHSAMYEYDRLEGSESQTTRSLMLRFLECDLRVLDERLVGNVSYRIRVQFLCACFQLRSYWLLDDEESHARREGVIKAFDTAIRLIEMLESNADDSAPVKYSTFLTTRTCFAAAVLITKVIHSSYGQYVDIERGKLAFNASISMFRECVVEDNDLNGRTTKVLAQLWGIHQSQFESSPQPPRLALKSRLFFSIAHDALWQWRELYAGQPNNGAPCLPPPFMSPTSADHAAAFSALSPTRTELGNDHMQAESFSKNIPTLSGQHYPSPANYEYVDVMRTSPNALLGQLHSPQDSEVLHPDPMQFDMLFPDNFMGYENSEQSWLYSMR